jgi:hypothetical protein
MARLQRQSPLRSLLARVMSPVTNAVRHAGPKRQATPISIRTPTAAADPPANRSASAPPLICLRPNPNSNPVACKTSVATTNPLP